MRSILALFFVSFVIFFPTVLKAEEKSLTACDQSDSLGSVFYDFDTLYIYYVGFMYSEKDAGFPEALKFENFNAKLLDAIKKNFALCLKKANGEDKPIVIIPPRVTAKDESSRMHDAKSLTLLITGNYFPQHEIAPGVKGIGYIQSYWYRPELADKHYQLPLGFIGGVLQLPPLNGNRSIEDRLDSFFKKVQPRKMPSCLYDCGYK